MLAQLFNLDSLDYTVLQWTVLCLAALLIGINKTGVPGIGILVVPLMAGIFEAKLSTGLVLPMLAFADIFAVGYYHRHARWSHIIKLLPAALVGIAAGSVLIRYIQDFQLKPLIGATVLAMLIISYWHNRKNDDTKVVRSNIFFALAIGFFAGLSTQLANAAGPIMVIYLLAMRLDKYEFIGTGAWYFLILNWLKIPIFVWEGRINLVSIKTDVIVFPLIIIGAVVGILLLKQIPQKAFKATVQILAVLAALYLIASVF